MRSLRVLSLVAAATLLFPLLRASVNEYNGTPCTTKKVMVKQYIFQDGVLGNCPAWEESVAYGATLIMTDYTYYSSSPDQWGNPQVAPRQGP